MISEIIVQIKREPEIAATILFIGILLGLEFLLPLKKFSFITRENKENIFWMFLNKILVTAFIGTLIVFFSNQVALALNIFVLDLSRWPNWGQFLLFFISSDIVSFFTHRLLHRNTFLWKFHQLHHSSTELTTWSSFRHHVFEDLYYGLSTTIFASLFIMDPLIKLSVFILVSGACFFQHANIRINVPSFISAIFITPLNHRWHHARDPQKPFGQNFGLFLNLWDKIFKSHYVPNHEPHSLGLNSEYPERIKERLLYPFIK